MILKAIGRHDMEAKVNFPPKYKCQYHRSSSVHRVLIFFEKQDAMILCKFWTEYIHNLYTN